MVEEHFFGRNVPGASLNRNRKLLFAVVAAALSLIVARDCGAQDSQWVLEQSTLTYHVSHPLHQVDGVSHEAKGKGVCHAGQCDFLIAVLVKSFDSGDSNRDLHMQQVTKAGQFPLVTVRTRLPEALADAAAIDADLQVEFAGVTVEYKQVAFQQMTEDGQVRIVGTIPAKVTDFKMEVPSLFAVKIKDEIPVHVEMTWRREK
jgi:hypothetical protein